jgi:PiT family inorganic phosphate transporter
MPDLTGMLLIVVVLALLFDFSNGWHDSANAIATVVSTRVASPFVAVMAAGVLNVAGAFMSTAVAKMVGAGSSGACNSCLQYSRWRLKSQRLSRTLVQA